MVVRLIMLPVQTYIFRMARLQPEWQCPYRHTAIPGRQNISVDMAVEQKMNHLALGGVYLVVT